MNTPKVKCEPLCCRKKEISTVHQINFMLFLFKESDTSQKRECKYNHPVQFMALKGTASGESSTDNMLAYSSISGDATVCEQQFSR